MSAILPTNMYVIRSFPSKMAPLLPDKRLVATWSDRGVVSIWDVTKHAVAMDTPGNQKMGKTLKEQALFSFSGHQVRT